MSADIARRADVYYVGAFDDEILRYNKTVLDLPYINETLSQAALFGGPLLINDGYLMHYPDGRRALVDRKASPFLDLLDEGYVRLYSRNDGKLSEMPLQMQHIPTYQILVKSNEWDDFKEKLKELEARLKLRGAFENWPRVYLGPGFQRLINVAFQGLGKRSFEGLLKPSEADRLLVEFNSSLGSDPSAPARTIWTQTCERPDLRIAAPARSFLHWLGIEAYHYNLTMASNLNDPTRHPGLITRYSYLFDGLREDPFRASANGAMLSEIPTPTLPRGIPGEALHSGAFLRQVVSFGTELHERKRAYLDAAQHALNDRHALSEAQVAADNYSTLIAGVLAATDKYRKGAKSMLTPLDVVTTTAGGLAGGAMLGAALGMLPGAIVGALVGWVGGHLLVSGGRRMLDSRVPLVVDMMESLKGYEQGVPTLSEPLQGPQWFAFLMVQHRAASEHADALRVNPLPSA